MAVKSANNNLSEHRQNLSAEARNAIEALNDDLAVGPHAKGDGDFIHWHFKLVMILGREFVSITSDLPPEYSGPLVINRTLPPQNFVETLQVQLFRDLRLFAIHVMDAFYPGMPQTQKANWEQFYDKVAVAEFRAQWGGRRVRVPARGKPFVDPVEQVAKGLRDSLHPLDAFKRAGVSRATGYRILAKKSK